MSLFITGTGTGVGKTVVTAGLAALLKSQGRDVCIYKPLQTGSPDANKPEDPEQIKAWVGSDMPTHCSYCFADPVAPYAADPQGTIQPHRLVLDFKRLQARHDIVLVEGAGGVRVPVAPQFEMIDLMRLLQLPVVVVASPYLGTVNQILLTLEALAHRDIPVKGVVISGMPEPPCPDPAIQSLPRVLEAFMPAPLLGMLPVMALASATFGKSETLAIFEALGLFSG